MRDLAASPPTEREMVQFATIPPLLDYKLRALRMGSLRIILCGLVVGGVWTVFPAILSSRWSAENYGPYSRAATQR
jgi:hypothetical protein